MFFILKIKISSTENQQAYYLWSVILGRGRGVIVVLRVVKVLAEKKKEIYNNHA